MSQEDFNRDQKEINKELFRHADIANEEMGTIKISVGKIETDISWMKGEISTLSNKTWFIITGVILSIVVQILLKK